MTSFLGTPTWLRLPTSPSWCLQTVSTLRFNIMESISNAIKSGVAAAGSAVGGAVDSAGKMVSDTGRSAGNTYDPYKFKQQDLTPFYSVTSYGSAYGNSTSDYGNSIRDSTASDSKRGQTSQNPLGLAKNKEGGKRGLANPDKARPQAGGGDKKAPSKAAAKRKAEQPAGSAPVTRSRAKAQAGSGVTGGGGEQAAKPKAKTGGGVTKAAAGGPASKAGAGAKKGTGAGAGAGKGKQTKANPLGK